MDDIIKIENVSKAYDKHQVLNNLDLSIKRGECFTLLGPSGCGKTVLLRLIAGFEVPETGKVYIDNTLVTDADGGDMVSADRRGLGIVFQDYAVWPHMTVFENVSYPLKIAKKPKEELTATTMRMIEMVGLKDLDKRLPSELSGGQQQRVALARALVANSSLMLLDEPLSNLDANLREEMRFEIKELQRELNVTVLYVTHDQEIALAIADRVAVMDEKGNIRQIGTPYEIFERPSDPFVFNFMGIANYLSVREEGGKYLVANGNQVIPWKNPEGTATSWVGGFRPSDVEVTRDGEGLTGVIKRASFLGATMHYLIDIDGDEFNTSIETHEAVEKNLIFEEGETCKISFKDLLWFDAEDLKEVTKQ